MEASASSVAGEWAEKTGFVARTKTPPSAVQDSTSSSSWEQLPEVTFFTDCDIYPAHVSAFKDIKLTFDGMQYMVDDRHLIVFLYRKMLKEGVKGRVILDKNNYSQSNSRRSECPMVEELRLAGCELWHYKQQGAGFASLHARPWVLDDAVVLTGSVNLTSNGMNRNKEHMLRISTPSVVRSYAEDFEDLWNKAEPISEEYCESQISAWRELPEIKEEKKKEKLRRSRSASLPRGDSTKPLETVEA